MKLFSFLLIFISLILNAEKSPKEEVDWRSFLTSYEPNLIGYSYDSDDKQPFLDFKLSLKYPIAYAYSKTLCNGGVIKKCIPYFAFTGRFGQYIENRNSSPVISKRFNPSLFIRLDLINSENIKADKKKFLKNEEFIDLIYGHESNGQRVTTASSWQSMADDFVNDGDKEKYANDYISRGWDYWGVEYNFTPIRDNLNIILGYRNFIGGLLQGDIEEDFDWEEKRKITSRKQINGLSATFKFQTNSFIDSSNAFGGLQIAINIDTGIHDFAKYNTYRIETTTKIGHMPFMIWYQHGYGADFAQYYVNTNTIGLAFELASY
jgi:hypothetical protein